MAGIKSYGTLDMRGNRVRNVGTPLASTDAATRAWVEAKVDAVQETDPAVHVGPTNGLTGPGIWIQTGLGEGGTGFTFWIEDGA